LPQLWNVLRGDMSLVGPRPDQVDQIRYYTEAEKVKLAVKPGITGLAQISGRNAIAWETRKVLDAEYVKRQSFLLDLVILCKTIPYILKREGVNSPAATSQEV
jgi:lipopolysaccharide/colanic/teichoic acid biosynthesis glycosyltransferase